MAALRKHTGKQAAVLAAVLAVLLLAALLVACAHEGGSDSASSAAPAATSQAQSAPSEDAAATSAQKASAESSQGVRQEAYEAGAVLVALSPELDAQDALATLISETGLQGTRIQEEGEGYVKLALPEGVAVDEAVELIQNSSVVDSVQPNYKYQLMEGLEDLPVPQLASFKLMAAAGVLGAADAQPNDPLYGRLWGLSSVHALEAWEETQVNGAVTVAVIDNIFNTGHEDLVGNIADAYNAVTKTRNDDMAATSYAGSDVNHGTHVAGIIAAQVNNEVGVAGVSHDAKLMLVRTMDDDGCFYTQALLDAYDYIIGNRDTYNVRVINMSLGGYESDDSWETGDDLLLRAIDKAWDEGIVTVTAAGNAGTYVVDDSRTYVSAPFSCYPGDYDACVNVINLRNTDVHDPAAVARSSSSNYNLEGRTNKDISAPGTSIYSTSNDPANPYMTSSGTSMAAPCVAGVLALEFAANPDLEAQEAVDVLYVTAADLGEPGFDRQFGWGEVNAQAAVVAARDLREADEGAGDSIADDVLLAPESMDDPGAEGADTPEGDAADDPESANNPDDPENDANAGGADDEGDVADGDEAADSADPDADSADQGGDSDQEAEGEGSQDSSDAESLDSATDGEDAGETPSDEGGDLTPGTVAPTNPTPAPAPAPKPVKNYKIKYVLKGGKQADNQVKYIKSGTVLKVKKLKKPTRKGYVFAGWYTNAKLTKKATVIKGAKSKKKRTLYAKWRPKKYKIAYKLRGGKMPSSYLKKYTYRANQSLPIPSRPGYAFLGWFKKLGAHSQAITAVPAKSIGKIRLYAKWRKRVLVAHRGYRKTEVGNSIEAFRTARAKGFKWAECDVRFTADGYAVIRHSSLVTVKEVIKEKVLNEETGVITTYKTVNKHKEPLSNFTLDELQSLSLANKKSGLTIDGKHKNLLEFTELLAEAKSMGLNLVLDLKETSNAKLRSLLGSVWAAGMQNNVRWLSTSLSPLRYIQSQQSNAQLMYGHSISSSALSQLAKLRAKGAEVVIQPRYNAISTSKANACRVAGVVIATWDLADERHVSSLNPGVSIVTVDGLASSSMPQVIGM